MTYDELHRAIKRGQLESVKKVVPAVVDPNASNRFSWSLLMLAALEGNSQIGMFLIEQGADVTALNDAGESALSQAAHRGHLPFVELLKSRGASGDVRPQGYDLENWLRNTSGLSNAKIDAILRAV